MRAPYRVLDWMRDSTTGGRLAGDASKPDADSTVTVRVVAPHQEVPWICRRTEDTRGVKPIGNVPLETLDDSIGDRIQLGKRALYEHFLVGVRHGRM